MTTSRVRQYAREEAARFGVKAGQILKPTRGRAIEALARKAVMRRLRDDGFSSEQIGRWLNRDGSTVRHLTGGRA